MFLFDINEILITILGYNISYLEAVGTIFGFICVYLVTKEKISSWPIGIINIIFFFILFYQIRLYSDMLLQAIFFVLSIYGWYKWKKPEKGLENKNNELKITTLSGFHRLLIGFIVASATFGLYLFMKEIHLILPTLFPEPAAAPLRDAFTTVTSVTAQWIMCKKKLESWMLWIAVDAVAFIYYFQTGVALVGIEYILFFCLAIYGLFKWLNEYKGYVS